MIGRYPNVGNPISRSGPGVGPVTNWWMSMPGRNDGGSTYYDLVGSNHGSVATGLWNLTPVVTFPRPPRPGGFTNRVLQGQAGNAIDCGNIPALDGAPFAILSGWMCKMKTTDRAAFGRFETTANTLRFGIAWYSDSNVYFIVDSGAGSSQRTFNFAAHIGWYFFEMVFDGSLVGAARVAAYINGDPAVGGATPTFPASVPAGGGKVFTFNRTNGDSNFHTGAYDDVRLEIASAPFPFKSRYQETLNGNKSAVARWQRDFSNAQAAANQKVPWQLFGRVA